MSTPTIGLFAQVVERSPLTAAGLLSPSCKYVFTLSGTSTPADVYNSSGAVISTSGVVTADANGQFQAIFGDTSKTYRVDLQTSTGVSFPNYPVDNVAVIGGGGSGSGAGLDIIQIEALLG